MFLRQRPADIHHEEHDENEGLHRGGDDADEHHGPGGEEVGEGGGDVGDGPRHRVLPVHVPKEAEPQGDGPDQVGDDLDGEDDHGHGQHGAHELLYIAGPVLADPLEVVEEN